MTSSAHIRLVGMVGLLCIMVGQTFADDNQSLFPQHYLGFSAGGACARDVAGNGTTYLSVADTLRTESGYGVHLGLQYELAYRGWFFGIGVSGRFHNLRDSVRNFTDSHVATEDKNGDKVTVSAYEYVFRNMHGQDQIGMVSIPLYLGHDLGQWAYLKVGATFSIPVYARYTAQAQMYTQGIYNWGWGPFPIRSSLEDETDFEESLNYYFEETYTTSHTYKDLLRIGLDGEIGAYILLDKTGVPSMKTRMRLGIYVSADFRIGQVTRTGIVDYTSVNEDPYTRTKAQLHDQLLFSTITHTDLYQKMPPTLEVGVRLTCLFNVSRKQKFCRCVNY